MKELKSYTLVWAAALLILAGCGKKGCEIPAEIANRPVNIEIERLEKPFFKLETREEILGFLNEHPQFSQKYLNRNRYPHDSILVNMLHKLVASKDIDQLVEATDQKFGDAKQLEQDLELAFKHITHYYPQYQVPRVQTFISGFANDITVTDSLLVLSLENFIGPGAPYRPDFPQYILQRYAPPYLVPTTVLAISNQFNKTDFLNKSLMAEMIYYGKAYYFTSRMLPCTPDSILFGYTDQNIADLYYNQDKIWAHFIERNLLYETNHFKVNKYIGERPATQEIGTKAPGRIGRWVGLQIVRAYMENHPDVTLQQLMATDDPQKIFTESKYKPKRPS